MIERFDDGGFSACIASHLQYLSLDGLIKDVRRIGMAFKSWYYLLDSENIVDDASLQLKYPKINQLIIHGWDLLINHLYDAAIYFLLCYFHQRLRAKKSIFFHPIVSYNLQMSSFFMLFFYVLTSIKIFCPI